MTKNILLFIILFSIVSCETVVDVDLSTAPERLVIDANIDWEKGTNGNIQTVILSKTTGYYQSVIPKVSGATVFITNNTGDIFDFIYESNGKYICNNFLPELGKTYTLTVIVEGKTYTATESLLPTPDITYIEQDNDLGLNNDEIGLRINFNDIPNQDNYYLLRTDSSISLFPYFQVVDDQFSQGNTVSGLYSDPDLVSGNNVTFKLYNVSLRYYNYMKLIITASDGANNGPFQMIPTIARGNIINQTNPDDFALGYFRLSETDTNTYTVE